MLRCVSSINKKSVCVIGAGPSGLSQLVSFAEEKDVEVVCFEKQADVGGQWNYDWHLSSDANGARVHGAMYRELTINGPKEKLEYPDFSYEDCFAKPAWPDVGDHWRPSFVPREIMKMYLKRRAAHHDVLKNVRLETVVRSCSKRPEGGFLVTSEHLPSREMEVRAFDNLIVANGHYSVPNVPIFPGIEHVRKTNVIHARDWKYPQRSKGKKVFCLGGSFSSEDVAQMAWKFGAEHVYVSSLDPFYHYEQWDDKITFHAALKEFRVKHHENGEQTEELVLADGEVLEDVDEVVFCTGYKFSFPFLDPKLRVQTPKRVICDNLYKGVFLVDDPDVMYLAMQSHFLTFTMFDAQAWLARDYCLGRLKLPPRAEMLVDIKKWRDLEAQVAPCLSANIMEATQLQIDAQEDVVAMTDYNKRIAKDGTPMRCWDPKELYRALDDWNKNKIDNVMTFRDKAHGSIYDKSIAPLNEQNWKDTVHGLKNFANF